MNKEGFIIYKSFFAPLSSLNNEQLGRLFRTIFNYQEGEEVNPEDDIKMAFLFIKNQFDIDEKKYQAVIERNRTNGKIGGRPKTQDNPNNPVGFEEPKKADKEKEKEKDKDKDKDIEKETTNVVSKESAPLIPYSRIVSAWNELCPSLPRILRLTDGRRQKIKSRLKEMTQNPDEYLDKCEELFRKIQSSKFLTGGGDNSWTASFDWVFSNGVNWAKVMEGNYDNKQSDNPHPEIRLGIKEFFDNGRRTYGDGTYTIPLDAPPRPSERHYWNTSTHQWLI